MRALSTPFPQSCEQQKWTPGSSQNGTWKFTEWYLAILRDVCYCVYYCFYLFFEFINQRIDQTAKNWLNLISRVENGEKAWGFFSRTRSPTGIIGDWGQTYFSGLSGPSVAQTTRSKPGTTSSAGTVYPWGRVHTFGEATCLWITLFSCFCSYRHGIACVSNEYSQFQICFQFFFSLET